MVYREGNQILKILLVFVISILFLTAVIYLVIVAQRTGDSEIKHYLLNPNRAEKLIDEDMDDYLMEIIDTEVAPEEKLEEVEELDLSATGTKLNEDGNQELILEADLTNGRSH